MNYLRNVALSTGVIATVALTPFAARSQTCADPSQTPLTKSRLDQIATSQGIPLTKVGLKFDAFARSTLIPSNPIPQNNKDFPSPLRRAKVGIANVRPDGVGSLVVTIFPFPSNAYPESVFYESKAVKYTLLPPSYQDYQILGFLDNLYTGSPAHAAGENPTIVFMTTSDVRTISSRTITEANSRGIGVWHAIACEIAPSSSDLQMSKAEPLNFLVYLLNLRFPGGFGGPGTPGRI